MPKKLEECVKALIREGYDEQTAYAICQSRQKENYDKSNGKPRTLSDKPQSR